MDFRKAASSYLKIGYHPIPCEPRGKKPLVRWAEYQDRQPTPEEVEAWAQQWPEANVGIVMGRGTLAVDCDGDFGECQELLRAAGIELPADAPRSHTGKGTHVLLSVTEKVGDAVALLKSDTAAVDIRGVGYIVAPPSVHPSGALYRWEVLPSVSEPPPPAPRSLVDRISGKIVAREHTDQPGWVTELYRHGAPSGQRDQSCTRLAGYFLGVGIPADVVTEMMMDWANRCNPPFSPYEVRKCVASIAQREKRDAPGPVPIEDEWLVPMSRVLDGVWKHIISNPDFVRLPYEVLNQLLAGGLLGGELLMIGARPGVGKSAMALEIGLCLAKTGRRALYVTREMGVQTVGRRIVAHEMGIDASKLRQAGDFISDEDKATFERNRGALDDLPFIVSSRVATVEQLARVVAEKGPWGLILVDYLQLMRSEARAKADKRIEVEEVGRQLKQIALDYDVPVIALSAFNRTTDDKKAPTMSMLRESGDLEHAADSIVLLWPSPEDSSKVNLELVKARDGEPGKATLRFDGKHQRFVDELQRAVNLAVTGEKDDLPF